MKQVILLAAVIGSLMVQGEKAKEYDKNYISPVTNRPYDPKSNYSFEAFKARDEAVLKKTGGFLMRKAEGPLALTIDTRSKKVNTIEEFARVYKLGAGLEMNVGYEARNAKAPLKFAQEKMKEKSPLFVLCVVEGCDDLPALSVFPEERIGIVNADKLKEESKDPAAPEMRVAKELWRAMGFIGGVGFSAQDNDMMQPYYTMKEMDANYHAYIQPMNMAKMQKFWQRWGVKKERRVPYKVAVNEGWAPMPTNEYQRAIWEQTHAVPKNPMQIKFDPKSGK